MLTVASAVQLGKAEIDQGVEVDIRAGDHMPASATIASIRSAERNEFLAAKRHTAVAAVSGMRLDHDFIDKFHGSVSFR